MAEFFFTRNPEAEWQRVPRLSVIELEAEDEQAAVQEVLSAQTEISRNLKLFHNNLLLIRFPHDNNALRLPSRVLYWKGRKSNYKFSIHVVTDIDRRNADFLADVLKFVFYKTLSKFTEVEDFTQEHNISKETLFMNIEEVRTLLVGLHGFLRGEDVIEYVDEKIPRHSKEIRIVLCTFLQAAWTVKKGEAGATIFFGSPCIRDFPSNCEELVAMLVGVEPYCIEQRALDRVVRVNDKLQAIKGGTQASIVGFVIGTLLHELGHVAGLQHVPKCLMTLGGDNIIWTFGLADHNSLTPFAEKSFPKNFCAESAATILTSPFFSKA